MWIEIEFVTHVPYTYNEHSGSRQCQFVKYVDRDCVGDMYDIHIPASTIANTVVVANVSS